MEIGVVQTLDRVHGFVGVVHVYEGEVLDDGALRHRPVLLKQGPELVLRALLHVGHVQLDRALVFAVTRLDVDGGAVELVQVEAAYGLGGVLAIVHVDEGEVLDDGALRDGAILSEQGFDFLAFCLGRQVPNEDLHHGASEQKAEPETHWGKRRGSG